MDRNLFKNLPLGEKMLAHLNQIGYTEMTPIQREALPHVLKNQDLIARAKTGSGKTAAFGIGLLHHLDVKHFRIQTLILAPTRELAGQVADELRKLARAIGNVKILVLCGGAPIRPQLESLQYGAHIIVGTPGRIQQHLDRQSLDLKSLKTVILDEGDRMLDMGFHDDIVNILGHTPQHRTTHLFSATFPPEIKEIADEFLNNPVTVSVDTVHNEHAIDARWYPVSAGGKNRFLMKVLGHFNPKSALIFCNTKQMVRDLTDTLNEEGCYAQGIHGDLEQPDRILVFARFKNSSYPILVATDVAARGLDISGIDLVVNYELPFDSEVYVHRVGRTGRAGESGVACSLYTSSEKFRLKEISEQINKPIEANNVDSIKGTYRGVPDFITVSVNGGKKRKVRKGDILGALTRAGGISGQDVGRIDIEDFYSYIAIRRNAIKQALTLLTDIKGRSFKVRLHR